RFLQHVLPAGFHKVRYYGLWHSSRRKQMHNLRSMLLLAKRTDAPPEADHADPPDPALPRHCPHCGTGQLTLLRRISPSSPLSPPPAALTPPPAPPPPIPPPPSPPPPRVRQHLPIAATTAGNFAIPCRSRYQIPRPQLRKLPSEKPAHTLGHRFRHPAHRQR